MATLRKKAPLKKLNAIKKVKKKAVRKVKR